MLSLRFLFNKTKWNAKHFFKGHLLLTSIFWILKIFEVSVIRVKDYLNSNKGFLYEVFTDVLFHCLNLVP